MSEYRKADNVFIRLSDLLKASRRIDGHQDQEGKVVKVSDILEIIKADGDGVLEIGRCEDCANFEAMHGGCQGWCDRGYGTDTYADNFCSAFVRRVRKSESHND